MLGTVRRMYCVSVAARLLRSIFPADARPGDVLLRHAPSGMVLSSASDEPAVRFASADEASTFAARFLDEPASWKAVPVSEAESERETWAA